MSDQSPAPSPAPDSDSEPKASGAATHRAAISAIRGMADVFPAEARRFRHVEETARAVFVRHGYGEIRTPAIEPTELFARTVGDSSDLVVSKQMYTFTDPGDRGNTLRPEGTAGTVRALVEDGLLKRESSAKVFYIGPMFRYEKPQKGRLRQFTQIGCEHFGVAHAAADAELVCLCHMLLSELGFRGLKVKLNTLADRDDRRAYNGALSGAITAAAAAARMADPDRNGPWAADWDHLAAVNPMRVFDTKVEAARPWLRGLPRMDAHVGPDAAAHFALLRGLLDDAGVPYEIDADLVRGLDYYCRTVFEVVATEGMGSQSAILGGGRYDYLVEELGGPPTPALGMAVGVERLLLAMEALGLGPVDDTPPAAFIAALDDAGLPSAFRLAREARAAGVRVAFEPQPRKAKAAMKLADRSGAPVAYLIGGDEAATATASRKDMATGEQNQVALSAISFAENSPA